MPVVYVNDYFGKWQSDFKKTVSQCLEDEVRGKPIAQLLAPEEDDYFVLKQGQRRAATDKFTVYSRDEQRWPSW